MRNLLASSPKTISLSSIFFLAAICWMGIAAWQLQPSSPYELPSSWPAVSPPNGSTYLIYFSRFDYALLPLRAAEPQPSWVMEPYEGAPEYGLPPYLPPQETHQQERSFLAAFLGIPLGLLLLPMIALVVAEEVRRRCWLGRAFR
jgi:hypothetical protein